jgi:predicted transglutaminase-like cysteine proteinase
MDTPSGTTIQHLQVEIFAIPNGCVSIEKSNSNTCKERRIDTSKHCSESEWFILRTIKYAVNQGVKRMF